MKGEIIKKKLFVLALVLLSLFAFTGCGKGNDEKKDEVKNQIIYLDDNSGYKVTFDYKNNEKYEITRTNESGKFKEIIFENKDKNLKFDIYFTETYIGSYNTQKTNRNASKGYKEYDFGSYKAYAYNADKYSLDFNVLLDSNEDKNVEVILFGNVEYIDYSTANVEETFNSSDVQEFLKTIKFTK